MFVRCKHLKEKQCASSIVSGTDVFGRTATLGGAIGFAYIDGNHTYDFAVRDFENVAAALLPGGYMLLDDSADYMPF